MITIAVLIAMAGGIIQESAPAIQEAAKTFLRENKGTVRYVLKTTDWKQVNRELNDKVKQVEKNIRYKDPSGDGGWERRK